MAIKEMLSQLAQIAKNNGLSLPYIVGGLPRDKLIGRVTDIEDVDLTTGDGSIHRLGQIASEQLKSVYTDLSYKVMPDGHSQIRMGGIQFDFSSNYNSPSAVPLLQKAGISSPSPMQTEMISRDFTCNTLVVPTDLSAIQDPTGMGVADIKKKILRTPLPPEITMGDNTKRVVRIIYLAAKLGFDVEPAIVDWVRKNQKAAIQDSSEKYLKDKLKKAMQYNSDLTLNLINILNVQNIYMPYITGL